MDFSRLKGFRFPRTVTEYAAWTYHRFALSLRDVEDLLASRGIIVSYETIRDWVLNFGVQFAKKIRRDWSRTADKRHLDEVVITIKGRKIWLWRAVDSNGGVLDILVQSRRSKTPAKRFFRKLFKTWGQPQVIVTDKLGSYAAAKTEIAPGIEHRQHKRLNNRSEASHRQTRRREKIMGRSKSASQAQRFLSEHDQTANLFRPKRHRLSVTSYRHARNDASARWTGYCTELSA